MRRVPIKYLVPIILLLLIVGYLFFSWWRGPVLAGYIVQPAPLVQTVVAAGRVMNPARQQISSEIAGVVVARHVQEGDSIAAGDILIEVRADNLVAQQQQAQAALRELATRLRPQAFAEVERAKTEVAQAKRETQRRAEMLQANLIATETFEQAQQLEELAQINLTNAQLTAAALAQGGEQQQQLQAELDAVQAQLAKAVIKAPAAGTILTRNIETGDVAQPNQVLFTVAVAGHAEVRAYLDERNLAQLALGQQAVIIADAYPNQPFAATLTFIAPAIDAERGTIEVRLTVNEPPEFLRQDMTVSVNIETARRESTLALPNEAIFGTTASQAQVWIVKDNRTELQDVSLGLRALTMSEVTKGLAPGDQVLIELPESLIAGQRVRLKSQSPRVTTD